MSDLKLFRIHAGKAVELAGGSVAFASICLGRSGQQEVIDVHA